MAPGNFFYGFKNREKTVYSKNTFEEGSEVILGRKRAKTAKIIYNRLLDFTSQFEYSSDVNRKNPETKQKVLEKISKKISSDDSLFNEMMEIFFKFINFGDLRLDPYPTDSKKWEKNNLTNQ